MKAVYILIGAAFSILAACNNNTKPGDSSVTNDEGTEKAIIKSDALDQSDEEAQKRIEKLQKLSPYTLDQMKGFLPEELAGAKRSGFLANSALGTAYAEGEYVINDSTKVKLELFDCAGPAGVGVYNSQFLSLLNNQSETDTESNKTIDLNGTRAIEQVQKDGSGSTLSYLAADRILVTFGGKNIGIDQLKKLASKLRFN